MTPHNWLNFLRCHRHADTDNPNYLIHIAMASQ